MFPNLFYFISGDQQNESMDRQKCPMCFKFFSSLSIQRHMLIHLPRSTLPFKCKVCGKGFNSLQVYQQHYRRKHAELDLPMTSGRFCCEICSSTVETRVKFLIHFREHRDAGETDVSDEELIFYQCDSPGCWILFRNRVQFDHHVVTAHPSSMICNVCGKCFADQNNYDSHQTRAHTLESNQVPCAYCWEIVDEDNVEAHRKKHVLTLNISDRPIAGVICHSKSIFVCPYEVSGLISLL